MRPNGQPEGVSTSALTILLTVMFVNMIGFGIIVPLLPFYAESFHAASWQVALIFSAYSVGAFFGEPFWGRLSDHWGRKPVLMITVCGNCACYLALAFAPGIGTAFLVRFLGGLASGNNSVVQSYLADVTREKERSARLAWVNATYNVGFIIGPAVGGWLASPELGTTGFRVPLFVAAALSALCVAGLALLVGESRAHGRTEPINPQLGRAFHELFRHPVIARLLLVTLLSGSAFSGVESMFGLWAQSRFSWGPHQVGDTFAIAALVAAFCQITAVGPLSRHFGEARVLAAGMAMTAASVLLLTLSQNTRVTIGLIAAAAFGQAIAWPNVAALISRHSDPCEQGSCLGLNNAAAALSRLSGPFVLGLAFSLVSVNAPFWLAALLVLPAIGLSLSARRIYFPALTPSTRGDIA
jgi:MFS family permease